MYKTIEIGFSPCPNDTFIFDAIVNGKIDTGAYKFSPVLEDVQTLNNWALEKKLSITKLSYATLPLVLNNYKMLNAGSALGKGVGPILISNKKNETEAVEKQIIAMPGKNTTANLLFTLAYPNAANKLFMRYDEIEDFVKSGKGLGVIIHENRFTYQDRGLHKINDLGNYWESSTGFPIPLGGIVIDRNIDTKIQADINILIKKSIEYAFQNNLNISEYIIKHSQELSTDVIKKHIDLYVNDFSLDLGISGKNAVMHLLELYCKENNLENFSREDVFVN